MHTYILQQNTILRACKDYYKNYNITNILLNRLDATTWVYRILCVINDLESLSIRAGTYMKGVGEFYCQ